MKKSFVIAAFCFLVSMTMVCQVGAATVRQLPNDMQMRPVGWKPRTTIEFRKGNVTVDDDDGGVKIGTLANDTFLWVWNSTTSLCFAGNTEIEFERAGGVIRGTICNNMELRVVNSTKWITFVGLSQVTFGYDGGVASGVIASDIELTDANGVARQYKAETRINFNEKSQIESSAPWTGGSISDALGSVWHESENGWNGVWTRRGTSNVFDAVWTRPGDETRVTAVLTMTQTRGTVSIYRRDTSSNLEVDYLATIGRDGSVTGNGKVRGGISYDWTAKIQGLGEQPVDVSGVWVATNDSTAIVTISQNGESLQLQGSVKVNGFECRWHGTGTIQGNTFSCTCIFDSIYPGGNMHNSSGEWVVVKVSPDGTVLDITWKNNGGQSGNAAYKKG